MKKALSLIAILALLLPLIAAFPLNTSAAMPSADSLGGYENICLSYTFDTSDSNYGRFTAEDFAPYVGYYDANNNLKDFFFDSFLFLPCLEKGPSGALMHTDMTTPTLAIDWTTYVNDTFADGYNVDALETAVGNAKQQLDRPEQKAGVFFTLLYPCTKATSFGTLGGRSLNFSKQDDRKYAIKWIIDEQIRLFNESNYQNLEMVGFYWLEEYLYSGSLGVGGKPSYYNPMTDSELFTYASQYLHSLGLKFIWIPWYEANGYKQWKTLGFDVACMQPNMFWQADGEADLNRVSTTNSLAAANGLSVEIEIDNRVFTNPEYYERYLVYLEDCMKGGAMNSIKMYYQDRNYGGVYKWAYKQEIPHYHMIYDLTYKYAKGTLTQADIDLARSGYPFDVSDLEVVSLNKPYTASTPYTGSGDYGYLQIDGKELTDGEFAENALGSEWHGFHYTKTESNGRFQIVVDLETIRNDLTLFYAQFCNYKGASIGNPSNVTLEISTDGTAYQHLGNLSVLNSDKLISHVLYQCAPVTARYVRMTFGYSTGNFVFCSELLVCADPNAENEFVLPEDGIYINGINEKIQAGTCHLFTPDFGVISASTANHVWTYNVVAKWSDQQQAYIVTQSFCGSGAETTPDITLADDEIMIAAHQWDTVPESLANIQRLEKAQVGNKLLLYNVDLKNTTITSESYARLEEGEPEPTPDPEPGNIYDVNNDGCLDIFDYLQIKNVCMSGSGVDDEIIASCDVNDDGRVDLFDYLEVKSAYFSL